MSQFNLNPMSVIDRTALGGFRAGMADQRSLLHSNSALAYEAQQTDRLGLDNETTRLKRPMDAVEQARKMQEEELRQKLLADGTTESGARADVDMKIAQAIGAMDTNARKRVEDQTEATLRASEFLKDKDDTFKAANWGSVAEDMRKSGIKSFPKTYSYPAYQRLEAASRAAWRTKSVLANESLEGIKQTNEVGNIGLRGNEARITGAQGDAARASEGALDRASRESISRAANATATANARTMAEARQDNMDPVKRAKIELEQAERSGDYSNLTSVQLNFIEAEMLRQRDRDINGNVVLRLENLRTVVQGSKDPEKKAEAIAKVKALRREALGPLASSLDKARAAIGASSETEQASVMKAKSKSGKPMISTDGGKSWTYE